MAGRCGEQVLFYSLVVQSRVQEQISPLIVSDLGLKWTKTSVLSFTVSEPGFRIYGYLQYESKQ